MTNKENKTWLEQYQELYEENTKAVLQFWTDTFKFWWGKHD